MSQLIANSQQEAGGQVNNIPLPLSEGSETLDLIGILRAIIQLWNILIHKSFCRWTKAEQKKFVHVN